MLMSWLFTMLCASSGCFRQRRVCEEPFVYVRLSSSWTRSSSLRDFRQDDHTLEITTIFALLDCSLFCYAYAAIPTTCLSCLIYCWTKPLTHLVLANRWLAMLPLCSAPLIALLGAGEDWSLFLVGTWRCCSLLEYAYLLGYHNISYLINASIYLVKGGRLGLSPSVSFHSCRPSFRHTGVMFLDFALLTWLGVMGTPW